MAKRPTCACCGKRYGQRVIERSEVVVEIGQPIPQPQSNRIAIMQARAAIAKATRA